MNRIVVTPVVRKLQHDCRELLTKNILTMLCQISLQCDRSIIVMLILRSNTCIWCIVIMFSYSQFTADKVRKYQS